MYAAYFNLSDNPFAITPDPAYLYLSPHHQEALGHLLYGTGEDGGFVQLTGEVGTGKTTVIRALLKQDMHNVDVALCLNPRLTVEEFLASICDELHIEYPREGATLKTLVDALNTRLLERHAQGRRTVLIVDEAQNLSPDVLEQVRLLTNLETHRHKLLRIILVGQPELQDLLERRDLRQLAQRITARYHLRPLTREETISYIRHRLAVAGSRRELFTASALRAVHQLAHGIPRLVNIICDRALLGAYAQNASQIDVRIVRRAAREALKGPDRRRARLRRYAAIAAVPLIAGLGFGAALYLWQKVRDPVVIEVPVPAGTSVPASGGLENDPVELVLPQSSLALQQSLASLPTDDDALRRLLVLWNAADGLPAGAQDCENAEAKGLRCLSGSGGWSELRRYDRPALLRLQMPDGSSREVLLRQWQGDQVVLELPEGPRAYARADLENLWAGDFLLLWRPPLGETLIGPSTTGEAVQWVRKQLTLADGKPFQAGPGAERFDEVLRNRVRAFQSARGITADGLAGARTLILLSNLTPDGAMPRLSNGVGDG
jgi:general secretion pathway protein A